jgi:hypothetical protein
MNGKRFDLKHVLLLFFLFQRGLGTGLTRSCDNFISNIGMELNLYEYRYRSFSNYLYFLGWDKSRQRYSKTANVCDYVGDVYNLFLDLFLTTI